MTIAELYNAAAAKLLPHMAKDLAVHQKFADRAAREAERRQDARATIQRLVQQ
ncbi:MAG: hypothetical protein JJ897_10240 [Marinibacterium sp.]|nr:hypothetical protein [Marinibacterium sp.]